jgi:hypothetical protein
MAPYLVYSWEITAHFEPDLGPSVSIDYGDGFDGSSDGNDGNDGNAELDDEEEEPVRNENLTNRPSNIFKSFINTLSFLTLYLSLSLSL